MARKTTAKPAPPSKAETTRLAYLNSRLLGEEEDGPDTLSDVMNLREFPGDLARARRLGAILQEVNAVLVEKVASLDEPDQTQMLEALSHWFKPPAKERAWTRPDKAPKLWADRDPATKINPAQFTREVYAEWFSCGLTRKDLRELDPKLYHALSVWEHRHPEDTVTRLQKLGEVRDRQIEELSGTIDPEELRKLATTLQSRHRRVKK